MNDFLGQLARRALDPALVIRPRPISVFEPKPAEPAESDGALQTPKGARNARSFSSAPDVREQVLHADAQGEQTPRSIFKVEASRTIGSTDNADAPAEPSTVAEIKAEKNAAPGIRPAEFQERTGSSINETHGRRKEQPRGDLPRTVEFRPGVVDRTATPEKIPDSETHKVAPESERITSPSDGREAEEKDGAAAQMERPIRAQTTSSISRASPGKPAPEQRRAAFGEDNGPTRKQPRTSEEPGVRDHPPDIHISIGRLEIRASSAPGATPAPRATPRISLDEYLKMSGGRR